jgi:hypothetical protein
MRQLIWVMLACAALSSTIQAQSWESTAPAAHAVKLPLVVSPMVSPDQTGSLCDVRGRDRACRGAKPPQPCLTTERCSGEPGRLIPIREQPGPR